VFASLFGVALLVLFGLYPVPVFSTLLEIVGATAADLPSEPLKP
jgi:hypothetical protein